MSEIKPSATDSAGSDWGPETLDAHTVATRQSHGSSTLKHTIILHPLTVLGNAVYKVSLISYSVKLETTNKDHNCLQWSHDKGKGAFAKACIQLNFFVYSDGGPLLAFRKNAWVPTSLLKLLLFTDFTNLCLLSTIKYCKTPSMSFMYNEMRLWQQP